jgi:DNA modification methylase
MHSAPDQVILGDCLDVLAQWPRQVVDLAYIDPPFNTGRTHTATNGAYRDTFNSTDDYLTFLRPRLTAVREVLKPNGSILLHCDWRSCHHLRLMLDELFGTGNFVNHLIWAYGLGGSSSRRFARKHDDILFYAKSEDYYFKPPMVPATSNRMKGRLKKASDVIEIPSINNMAHERSGYPTQKPLALLKLLIDACCPPNGLVLDPMCGSGTTLLAATQTSRRYLGIDTNPAAIQTCDRRLDRTPVR